MLTSQFIRLSDKSDIVFNVAQIAFVQRATTTLKTDAEREAYEGFHVVGDKVFSIMIYTVASQGRRFFFESEASRDTTFQQIIDTLNPYVMPRAMQPVTEQKSPA